MTDRHASKQDPDATPACTSELHVPNGASDRPRGNMSAAPSEASSDTAFAPVLQEVFEMCRAQGVRLTELRQRLLIAMWHSKTPLTAYALMHQLEHSWGRSLVPMTVYRALSALIDLNVVVRLESRNAYLLRTSRENPNASVFLICNRCNASHEVSDLQIEHHLAACANGVGFTVHRTAIELGGLCNACRALTINGHLPGTR